LGAKRSNTPTSGNRNPRTSENHGKFAANRSDPVGRLKLEYTAPAVCTAEVLRLFLG
jgi:hypothetical protein